MHLDDFSELVSNTKNVQQLVQVNPVPLMSFTRENQEVILQALLSGQLLDKALMVAKVKKKHYDLWSKLAEREIEPFHSFIMECDCAQGLFDLELVQEMRRGGAKYAAELYKMRNPDQVVGPHGHSQTPQINVNQSINFVQRTKEEKKAIIDDFFSRGEIIEG